jgi:hypothetical protein
MERLQSWRVRPESGFPNVRGRNRADIWPEASVGSVKPGTALPHPDPLPPIGWAGEGITKKANRKCNDGSPFVVLSEANHLPAAAGASLRVSFMPDPAPEIIRQRKRLECAKNIRLPAASNACAG